MNSCLSWAVEAFRFTAVAPSLQMLMVFSSHGDSSGIRLRMGMERRFCLCFRNLALVPIGSVSVFSSWGGVQTGEREVVAVCLGAWVLGSQADRAIVGL